MDLNWILLLLVGVCVLFADKIDEAAKADGKVKKVILVCGVGVLLIDLIPWLAGALV